MREDTHECAAIWAAVTVCRYVGDGEFGEKARQALREFKKRIRSMDQNEGGKDWQETRDFVVKQTEERLAQLANFI